MTISPDTISQNGSGLVFVNTYSSNVNSAFHTAIVAAENFFESEFTNAVTVHLSFDLASLSPSVAAQNLYHEVTESYSALTNALKTHATTPDDIAAVNSLPAADPSGGQGFVVPDGMARALGFLGAGNGNDDSITLNSNLAWTFGTDAIGALEHEISEGIFGRVGGLGIQNNSWGPMDLFRYTAGGQHDFTGGTDGQATYFSVDGIHILTQFQFHNSESLVGGVPHFDGFDFADWNNTTNDAFGPGGPSAPGTVSSTDLRILNILGWTPATSPAVQYNSNAFASSLTDAAHPFGQITANTSTTGALNSTGDRTWFQAQLAPGTYEFDLQGHDGGGGTLLDPLLRLYNSSGTLLALNDDIVSGVNHDSRLTFNQTTGTVPYYLVTGAFNDSGNGSYELTETALNTTGWTSTAGPGLIIVGTNFNQTLTGGPGDDTFRSLDGTDMINGGGGFNTAVYSGLFRQYQLTGDPAASGATLQRSDGTDTFNSIQDLSFADGSLFFSPSAHIAQAERLYLAALDRLPDPKGLNDHTALLDGGLTLSQDAQGFVNSPEFQATYGPSLSSAQFVTLLYSNVLHRAPDSGGLAFYVNNLTNGITRGEVVTDFSESPEFINDNAALFNAGLWQIDQTAASVARLYLGALGRAPDVAGLEYHEGILKAGTVTLIQDATNFTVSPEFQATYGALNDPTQFVTQLYQNVLGRAPDSGGLAFYVNNLNHGVSRGETTLGFTESPEYQLKTIGQIDHGVQAVDAHFP